MNPWKCLLDAADAAVRHGELGHGCKPLAPTRGEAAVRQAAAEAAQGIKDALASKEKLRCDVTYLSGRPRYWHIYRYPALLGFTKTVAGSTRARNAPPTVTYAHDLLPRWEYRPDELWELIQDLENLAAGKGQPTVATAQQNKPPRESRPGQGSLL